MSFVLQWAYYLLTQVTSAISCCVISTCKTVIVILAGVVVFGEKMSLLNVFGFAVCFVGLLLYAWLKSTKMEEKATLEKGGGYATLDEHGISGGGRQLEQLRHG